MREDVAVLDVRAEGHRNGHRLTTVLAESLAAQSESADVGDPAGKHIGNCGSEHERTIEIEERQSACCHAADISSTIDPALDEGVDVGDFRAKAITSFAVRGAALDGDNGGAMLRLLDALIATPNALVSSDFDIFVEETNAPVIGNEGEGPRAAGGTE